MSDEKMEQVLEHGQPSRMRERVLWEWHPPRVVTAQGPPEWDELEWHCSVNGTIVFRHPISLRTAVMSMISEKILLDSGRMLLELLYQQDPQHRVAR